MAKLRHQSELSVHLGCADEKLPGFVNIDCRRTQATDVTLDLDDMKIFAPGTVKCFFSNAFFEHLYRNSRLPHLRSVRRALNPEYGFVCYMGLPHFRNIARFYLERAPGTAGPTFDLHNVYRYTHGDPEHVSKGWLEQLHKSLFDEQEIRTLLTGAGFLSYVVFCYSFPGDYNEVPVCLGFYATAKAKPQARVRQECTDFVSRFKDKKIRLVTLRFLRA